ncbi:MULTISPECIES: SDR family NAD(P)-dependent oxidoreductase [unclassified Roseovarius]|uniref:SDR family NAD(P)-dependent oxidoreductase n=1 Tax=unclassified Roseovarius TaxID=2614913 RepID=UPI00273D13A0|nr:SDR family oxidoreductase [Roseovarius sp. MMSF_3350]
MTRTVIVTGAGSGIGAATAKRFADDGWNVVLNGRTREKLEAVAAELPEMHVRVVQGDVANPDDAARLVEEAVDSFGGLTCLINNAGIARGGEPGALSHDDFNAQMHINVGGTFNCVTAALPELKKADGACIVNTSSVSGERGDWAMFGYNASKGAISNMTRAMALDLAPEIRVNAVAPSLTETELTTDIRDDDALMKRFSDRIPMGRGAKPEEVASVIAFLASHDARFVNGVVLPVDGGLSASNGQPNFSA